jgi:hypothetical protein
LAAIFGFIPFFGHFLAWVGGPGALAIFIVAVIGIPRITQVIHGMYRQELFRRLDTEWKTKFELLGFSLERKGDACVCEGWFEIAPHGFHLYLDERGLKIAISPQELVTHTFGLDAQKWYLYEKARQKLHPAGGYTQDYLRWACVFPWVLHHIIFAPILWCFPMFCRAFCRTYKQASLPQCPDQALVLTETGIRVLRASADVQDQITEGKVLGLVSPGATWTGSSLGLTWSNLDLDGIVIKRVDTPVESRCLYTGCGGGPKIQELELTCALGWGCCEAQGYFICCQETVPDGYTIIIPSKSRRTVHNLGASNGGSVTLNNRVTLNIRALAADADTVLRAIRRAGSRQQQQQSR